MNIKKHKYLFTLSVVGFILCLLIHLVTFSSIYFERYVPSSFMVGMFSILIFFLVFKKSVHNQNTTVSRAGTKVKTDFYLSKEDFKYAPRWLKYLTLALVMYSIVIFFIFNSYILNTQNHPIKLEGKYVVLYQTERRVNLNNLGYEKLKEAGKLKEITLEEYNKFKKYQIRVAYGCISTIYAISMTLVLSKNNEIKDR